MELVRRVETALPLRTAHATPAHPHHLHHPVSPPYVRVSSLAVPPPSLCRFSEFPSGRLQQPTPVLSCLVSRTLLHHASHLTPSTSPTSHLTKTSQPVFISLPSLFSLRASWPHQLPAIQPLPLPLAAPPPHSTPPLHILTHNAAKNRGNNACVAHATGCCLHATLVKPRSFLALG